MAKKGFIGVKGLFGQEQSGEGGSIPITDFVSTPELRFDYIGGYLDSIANALDLSGGDITLSLNTGVTNIAGVCHWFYVVADGVGAINLGTGFNPYAIAPQDLDGKILDAGTYLVMTVYTNEGISINIFNVAGEAVIRPVATNVSFYGSEAVGGILTGTYSYFDGASPSLPESGSTYRWLRYDDDQGTNEVEVATTQAYTLVAGDLGKRMRFEVTVANTRISGLPTPSGYTGVIASSDVTAPTFTFDPANGTVDNVVTTIPVITANEAIRNTDGTDLTDLNVASVLILKQTDAAGADISFVATIDNNKRIVTITPDAALPNGTPIYVAINNVEDYSGNEVTTAISVIWTVEFSDLDDGVPYFEDSAYYVNRYNDGDETTSGTEVTGMVNRSNPSNSLSNLTAANTPADDDTNKYLTYAISDFLASNDIFITRGASTFTFVLEVGATLIQNPSIYLSWPDEGVSSRRVGWQVRTAGRDCGWLSCNPANQTLIDSNSGRVVDAFLGKVIVSFAVDSVNGVGRAVYLSSTYAKDDKTFTITTEATESFPLNRLEVTAADPDLDVRAVIVHNTILTPTEMKEVQNFFANQIGLTPWA